MKLKPLRSAVVALFLILALGATVFGCFGGDNDQTPAQNRPAPSKGTNAGVTTATDTAAYELGAEAFSNFQSKDPFIPQAVPPSTEAVTTTSPGQGASTTYYTTSTRSPYPTVTLRPTSTTKPTSTTTTKPPTTTTTIVRTHSLRVLSIGVVGSADAVTFQVDNSIYKDKREGDVVSSSWGQIQVLNINSTSKVVTLLHGSETRVLTVGSLVYE